VFELELPGLSSEFGTSEVSDAEVGLNTVKESIGDRRRDLVRVELVDSIV
jgi:hypothetical protein